MCAYLAKFAQTQLNVCRFS